MAATAAEADATLLEHIFAFSSTRGAFRAVAGRERYISEKQFSRLLRRFGLELTDPALAELMQLWGADQGNIAYEVRPPSAA